MTIYSRGLDNLAYNTPASFSVCLRSSAFRFLLLIGGLAIPAPITLERARSSARHGCGASLVTIVPRGTDRLGRTTQAESSSVAWGGGGVMRGAGGERGCDGV